MEAFALVFRSSQCKSGRLLLKLLHLLKITLLFPIHLGPSGE